MGQRREWWGWSEWREGSEWRGETQLLDAATAACPQRDSRHGASERGAADVRPAGAWGCCPGGPTALSAALAVRHS